jgi:hypothetical protein
MRLSRVDLDQSPLDKNAVRLSARVAFENQAARTYWIDVPESYAHTISMTGNTWLAFLLPLTMTVRENLRIDLPVDAVLYQNALKAKSIWKRWYPYLTDSQIEVESYEVAPFSGGTRTAAYFSGGIDSHYTLLSHHKKLGGDQAPQLDDLIYVRGFDITYENQAAYDWSLSHLQDVIRESGLDIIFLAYGELERNYYRDSVEWGLLAHGAVLVSTGLAMEKHFKQIIIPSGVTHEQLVPWGSHPETDPLFSTSTLKIIHDSNDVSRTEKTLAVANRTWALNGLRVCGRVDLTGNCGKCGKCLRTMVTLDVYGKLHDALTFDTSDWSAQKIRLLRLKKPQEFDYWQQILDSAREQGCTDIADELQRKLDKDKLHKQWITVRQWLYRYNFGRWLIRKSRAVAYKLHLARIFVSRIFNVSVKKTISE